VYHHQDSAGAGLWAGGLLLSLLLDGEGPLALLLDLAPVCEGDLDLLATAAAVTGASDHLALDSLRLVLVLVVDRGM
jgi:hypothetical protein